MLIRAKKVAVAFLVATETACLCGLRCPYHGLLEHLTQHRFLSKETNHAVCEKWVGTVQLFVTDFLSGRSVFGKGEIEIMNQATDCSVTDRGLRQQGYTGLTTEELAKLKWGLRFTPTVCMAGCVVGLATQSVWIHYSLAVLGMLAVVLPAHHPLDMLYNYCVRLVMGGPKLPPNPLPRSTACFLGGLMNMGIAFSFQAGQMALAYVIGGALVILQLIVISSHVCIASWLLELIGKVIGRVGPTRIDPLEARQLVTGGAVLLDVRSHQEFAATPLPEAVNIPVGELRSRLDEVRQFARPVVVYCASGMRSNRAAGILKSAEIQDVHDLGSLSRW